MKETASQGTVAQIIKFVRPEMAFNPEDTANLTTAYDKAIEQLHLAERD